MNTHIFVEPFEYNKTSSFNIDNIIISVIKFVLFQSLTLQVTLRSGENNVDIKSFLIEGEEYENWGIDDNYIVELIKNKLNITQPIIVNN